MVVLKDRSYLITTRVNLGQFFGQPEEDAYITMREPDTFDANRLRKVSQAGQASGDSTEILETFAELLPKLITDHNFYDGSEDVKMPVEKLASVVMDKPELFAYLVQQYSENVLFILGKKSE